MMNANEARKNVEEFNNQVIQAREERVNHFLNTTVEDEIKSKSNVGKHSCKVTQFVSQKDTELAVEKIEELGYTVSLEGNNFILIQW